MERRLAAILATDVVGYSRLIRADEEGTIAALKALRADLVEPKLSQHNGRIVKLMGDGMLAEFQSAVDAVRAAVETQEAVAKHNSGLPEDKRIQFRVGINLGDVVVDGDDIHGDGVNVAARMESLAEPGGICISDKVYEEVRDRMDLPFEDLGEQKVKNITRPIHVWRWIVGSTRPTATTPVERPPLPDKPSIAVLPFDNMSDDPEQGYFADGITEDIITELSRFAELHLVSRNSAFVYKGKPVKTQDVSRDLNVRYVMQGSVRKSGNRVRIVVQLIDALTDNHVWAERYDRKFEDIFAVQDEVTRNIVATLAGRLEATERQRVRTDRTENLGAYDYLLRGREIFHRFTPDANHEARRFYEKAIALDPNYARAYASLVWTYILDFREAWSDNPEEALDRALEVSRKGAGLCPTAHSIHLTLGHVLLHKGMHEDAIEALEAAVSLNPNDADSYVFLARALAYSGRPDDAVELVEEAMRVNSNFPNWYIWTKGMAYFIAQRYDEAITTLRNIKSPETRVYRWLAAAYGQKDYEKEARAAAEEYLRRSPHFSFDHHRKTEPFKETEDLEHYLSGLRKAGLPE